MCCPAEIDNNRDIDTVSIHTVNEFISGGNLSFLVGVEESETGVTLNILAAVILYLGRKYVSVKVDNHRHNFSRIS